MAAAEEQALRFQHLGVEDGLSDSWARAVLKDDRGFLWVGTSDGLNRYDGSAIVVHRTRLEDVHSLASSEVTALFEDDRKRLWVGAGMLHLYDRKMDRFDRYPLGSGVEAPAGLQIHALRVDGAGQVWVGTNKGLFRVDPATGQSVHFVHDPGRPDSLPHDSIVSLLVDRRGRLWVGTSGGLCRYEPTRGFLRIFQEVASTRLRTVNVETMIEDERGTLWLGTIGQGLLRLHPDTGEMAQYLPDARNPNSIGGTRVLSLATDGKGWLYVGAEDAGLDVLEMATGRILHHRPDAADAASLSSSSIYQLAFDPEGILWIGTFNGGVDYISPFGQRFGLVRARVGGLGNPHVLALLEDHRGDLWIGTDGGGLVHWDRGTGRFTSYKHDAARSDTLASNAVLALHEDAEHMIWAGTWAGGLDRLDPSSGRFVHHLDPAIRIADSIFSISPDRRGKLILGTYERGAQVFDPRTGAFQPLASLYPGASTSDIVLAVAVEASGNLWVTEPAGPLYVDRQAGTATRYPLLSGAPQALLLDSRGHTWIGSSSGGLYCLGPDRRLARRYTVADGLPSDSVGTVLEDESGNLWVGTTRGIARIKDATQVPAHPQVRRFDTHDGLQGSEFTRRAAYKSRTGEMFFGGQRGFNHFFPKEIQTNPHVPPVVFTGFRLFNQPVPAGTPDSPLAATSITEASHLVLSPRDSMVTFEFAALDFALPARNQYKYKLEGFDARWNEVGNRKFAIYTNLPAGDYTLRVAGSNNDGLWNEEGARLAIRVLPPFWRTSLFQSLSGVSLLGTAFAAYHWRVRKHRRAERALTARIQVALAEIKTLSGLLPMCAWCKKIRDEDGHWDAIEVYVKDRTQAEFTHGICPECSKAMRRPAVDALPPSV